MKYLITFLDNNIKWSIFIGGNMHGIYYYQEIIGSLNNLKSSGQISHQFGTSYYTINDTATIKLVIEAFQFRQMTFYE